MAKRESPATDAFIEAEVATAIAPFGDLLPPDALDAFAESFRDVCRSHPVASELVEQLLPSPTGVLESDEMERGSLGAGVVRPIRRDEKKPNR